MHSEKSASRKKGVGRRTVLKTFLAASAFTAAGGLTGAEEAQADGAYPNVQKLRQSMGVERVARLTPFGYLSNVAPANGTVKWVQIDLGAAHAIDYFKLMPLQGYTPVAEYFAARFKIEVAADAQFAAPQLAYDHTRADFPAPGDRVVKIPGAGVTGRFVRLTAILPQNGQLGLSKLEAWSQQRDVAQGRRVTDSDGLIEYSAACGGDIAPVPIAHGAGPDQAEYEILRTLHPSMPPYDSTWNKMGQVVPLTRRPRPQGEGVVTDNPGNVIPAGQWKPVKFKAQSPRGGVRLAEGLFLTVMQNNIQYLLGRFGVPELLAPFRTRAGKPNPPNLPPPVPFWDTSLPGSNAGRFMMGAGSTLQWMEHAQLRGRLTAVVAGIAACRRADGYAMAYPEDTIFLSERAAYTRSWVTHGLVDAGDAGHKQAYEVLRGFYDWFNRCDYLPELLRRAPQGVQGMIANTRTYFTPIGKPADIQVIQRYFQENYWLTALAGRDPNAVWRYPYDHPHCYLLTSVTPYLDQYRATGERKYLNAVLGAWDLYRDNWQHIGGAISICEGFGYPPRSAFLHLQNGENCGSSFWASLNHGLLQLSPTQERYANEIEKSIYNVLIANQAGTTGIRYHAVLDGQKEAGTHNSTCCEGQGTRQYGSLPQYIYSVGGTDDHGTDLYVNLFAASSIQFSAKGRGAKLTMDTRFPLQPQVRLTFSAKQPVPAAVHLRIPGWAAVDMPVAVNGKKFALGKPGTYLPLKRTWGVGDTISFTLPMRPRLSLYTGMDQLPSGLRYAVEYGPILLAAVGPTGHESVGTLDVTAEEILTRLRPIPRKPLHFAIAGEPHYHFKPYYQIDTETFTCFPVLKTPTKYPPEAVGADDLALASKGATATSDSELAGEPGCTGKVIDGVIATPADFTNNRWHSSLTIPHPHWVQVKLPRAQRIGRIVINFADPLGHPVSFQGIAIVDGREHVVFNETNYEGWREYVANIPPVTTDTFRLIVRASANPRYPNAAQISQIQLYKA